mmetsp:Transcript_2040/g.2893  ORF Transcript_2040/g.2893 Transcript_2040/m.2893 type:complete len:1042 (-) Transcript_2040:121-3246(-)
MATDGCNGSNKIVENESNGVSINNRSNELGEDEVIRFAIRTTMSALANLDAQSSKMSNDDLMAAYIKLCPFASHDGGCEFDEIEAIDASTILSNGSCNKIGKEEVTRSAVRIAISAFQKLEAKSSITNDIDLMKAYIKMCPYVDIAVIEAVLRGLDSSKLDVTKGDSDVTKGDSGNGISKQKAEKSRFAGIIFCYFGYILRVLILEFPISFCFAVYLAAAWTHQLHDKYLEPQIRALEWTEERKFDETTYYKRLCTSDDLSASKGKDLFLSIDATSQEAYEHQLKHGITVFPSVLEEEAATQLRDYIISRNHNLTEEESIFVIEGDNRYSFALGSEEPSVSKAMAQISTNERFKPALEKILGRNPALIEMTAITASSGAKPQYWHDDVISSGSAMQFGRAFGPSYSIFIQLQNTTEDMGATQVCPGTHYCATGSMDRFCEKKGFQIVGESGYWSAGDALLMNMNIWHRGEAHVDPTAGDRVMLILTFVPQPQTYAESRQMSQGITFSLRWDMWGHTLYDLADAKRRMSQPWATLRALGLYKPKDADWGLDFITSASQRIANEDNGFRDDQLEDYLESGGFPLLPQFLHGEMGEGDKWLDYYFRTVVRCENFFKTATYYSLIAYFAIQVLFLIVDFVRSRGVKRGQLRRSYWSLIRLLITNGILYFLYKKAIEHVDGTQWAKDIVANRRYTDPFTIEEDRYGGPSVYPHRQDVLFETRYKSKSLAMYNDFVMGHPGNRQWKELLLITAPLYVSYKGLPKIFLDNLSEFLVSSMESQQRRFLYQKGKNHWIQLSRDDALKHNERQIRIHSTKMLELVYQQLEFLISDCNSGHLRDKAMTTYDIYPYLSDLADRFLGIEDEKIDASLVRIPQQDLADHKLKSTNLLRQSMKLALPVTNAKFVRRPYDLHVGKLPGEPEAGAWRSDGDVIEVRHKGEGSKRQMWYWAKIREIHSSGWHHVELDDGEPLYVKVDAVRAYMPFEIGEKLEVWMEDDVYAKAEVTSYDAENDTVDVFLTKEEKSVQAPITNVRRKAKSVKKKKKTQYY